MSRIVALVASAFHDLVLVHIAHHAAPCVVPEMYHARAAYRRYCNIGTISRDILCRRSRRGRG